MHRTVISDANAGGAYHVTPREGKRERESLDMPAHGFAEPATPPPGPIGLEPGTPPVTPTSTPPRFSLESVAPAPSAQPTAAAATTSFSIQPSGVAPVSVVDQTREASPPPPDPNFDFKPVKKEGCASQ